MDVPVQGSASRMMPRTLLEAAPPFDPPSPNVLLLVRPEGAGVVYSCRPPGSAKCVGDCHDGRFRGLG